jgi:hypothetical protein
MNKGRKLCVAAVLALVLLGAFGATASPPPLPSSFYGSSAASGFSIAAGMRVSAWYFKVSGAPAPESAPWHIGSYQGHALRGYYATL